MEAHELTRAAARRSASACRGVTDVTPEETAFLVARTRTGVGIVLACVALFTLADFDVPRQILPRLYTIKIAHVLLALGLLATLRWVRSWRTALAVAFAVVNGSVFCLAATDIIAGHLETTPMLPVVAGMGAAALLPWGVWPQAATAVLLAIVSFSALACTGRSAAELADPATTIIGALAVSVYVSYQFDRYRGDRRRAETALADRAHLEALRADVRQAAIEDMSVVQKLRACTDAVVRHLDATCALVWTLDATGTVLELAVQSGDPVCLAGAPRRLTRGTPGIGIVAAEREPRLVIDARRDDGADYQAWARARGLVGCAVHPVLADDRVLGVVATFARRPFGESVLEALAAVAFAVAGSIERATAGVALARSQERLEEEARVSAALARVAEEMFSSLDTPVVLERLCELTAGALGCDYTAALLWRPEVDAYVPVAFEGVTDGERAVIHGLTLPRESLTALFTAAEGDHAVIEMPLSRLAGVALRRGKDLVGVQVVGWRHAGGTLTPAQRRIAQGVARVASMALANAGLVEELARVSRLKSEFVSTMSHELRTPLNVILGYAEMARDADAGEERATYLAGIETAGRELLGLIESTLEIGRIEAGRLSVDVEPVALRSFYGELGRSCTTLPRARDVALEWASDVPDVVVATDPRKLAIVLRNLVGNALKFTEQGSVRVRATRDGEELVLRVTDTGIGIRREDQEAIFEMFRQADGSDSRRFGGTGLGLYIVRRFVQALGGRVLLESAPGRGSTFTVVVPWREATPSVHAA